MLHLFNISLLEILEHMKLQIYGKMGIGGGKGEGGDVDWDNLI